MRTAKDTLDQTYLEMRWRALSLAADFDRIERAPGGADVIANDPRIGALREAMRIAGSDEANRAERVQVLLSDSSPVAST